MMINCTFVNNIVEAGGGALYLEDIQKFEIKNSNFVEN